MDNKFALLTYHCYCRYLSAIALILASLCLLSQVE